MQNDVRNDILKILRDTLKHIRNKDLFALKELSNHTVHDASIYQDENSVATAVMIYALYKIFDRKNYRNYKTWNIFYKSVVTNLKKAELALKRKHDEHYQSYLKDILKVIDKLDKKLNQYIGEIFEQSKIHKASRLHEHGVSVGRTAELLGVSEWELMDYIGGTGISDVNLTVSMDVKNRLKFARSLFK